MRRLLPLPLLLLLLLLAGCGQSKNTPTAFCPKDDCSQPQVTVGSQYRYADQPGKDGGGINGTAEYNFGITQVAANTPELRGKTIEVLEVTALGFSEKSSDVWPDLISPSVQADIGLKFLVGPAQTHNRPAVCPIGGASRNYRQDCPGARPLKGARLLLGPNQHYQVFASWVLPRFPNPESTPQSTPDSGSATGTFGPWKLDGIGVSYRISGSDKIHRESIGYRIRIRSAEVLSVIPAEQ